MNVVQLQHRINDLRNRVWGRGSQPRVSDAALAAAVDGLSERFRQWADSPWNLAGPGGERALAAFDRELRELVTRAQAAGIDVETPPTFMQQAASAVSSVVAPALGHVAVVVGLALLVDLLRGRR